MCIRDSCGRLEMYDTRGRSKRRAEDTEKEEGEQGQEIEIITDSEMEQQTDEITETEIIMDQEKEVNEEDAQGDQPDKSNKKEDMSMQELLRIIMESNKQINEENKENFRKQEEKFDKINEENKENLREQFRKQEEKFDKTNEENKENSKLLFRQMKEEILQLNEENLRRMDERIEKMNEAGLKRTEDKREQFNNEIMETFEGKFENDNTLSPEVDKYKEETNKEIERYLKNMSKTLDSTSEGIIVNPTIEENIQKIRKICRKKIVNRKEEMEMGKGVLISAYNIPINERRELCKGMKYRRNFMKITKINHHTTITKTLNKFKYYSNISTSKEYLTTSFISLIRKITVKHLVNSPDIEGNGKVEYTSDYVRIEEIRYLIINKELNTTEHPDLNEDFASAELQYQIHERYVKSVEIGMNTAVIRTTSAVKLMDHG